MNTSYHQSQGGFKSQQIIASVCSKHSIYGERKRSHKQKTNSIKQGFSLVENISERKEIRVHAVA